MRRVLWSFLGRVPYAEAVRLQESAREDVRRELEQHLAECPNCWVLCDTTKKTLEIFRGTDPYPIPEEVHNRLITALRKRAIVA